jgi:hypothetical protein
MMNPFDQILPDPTPGNKNKYRSFKYRYFVFVDLTLSRFGVINDAALLQYNSIAFTSIPYFSLFFAMMISFRYDLVCFRLTLDPSLPMSSSSTYVHVLFENK